MLTRNYKELACSVVLQAVKDYYRGKLSDRAFKAFCHSEFEAVMLDGGDSFYEKVRKNKKDGKTRFYNNPE